MAIGLKFRDMIPQWAIDELDQLVSAIRSYLLEPTGEHKEDGSHGDITADSLTLDPVVTNEDAADPENIRWSVPKGEMSITGYDNQSFGRVMELKTTWNDDANKVQFVSIRAQIEALGVPTKTSQISVLASRFAGANVGFVQIDADKTVIGGDLQVNQVIYERLRIVPLGEWEAYTPVWTNITVGNGTNVGAHARVGKTVHFCSLLVFGTTTTVGGAVSVTFPINRVVDGAAGGGALIATIGMFDTSVPARYMGGTFDTDSATMALFTNANPMVPLNTTVPFTWATGDELWVTGTYEQA